ncbi:cytochrome P450 [Streptomyces sp. TRM70308]|uniref:cytochrome P450 n=1 Tax=Streptomyces sp. TRM70308 TaxID=3131932 RepID=UPI003CFF9F55
MTAGPVPAFPFDDWGLVLSPVYAELRDAGGPAHRVRTVTGDLAWLVTRHDVARTVLGDPRFSLTAALEPDAPRQEPVQPRADNTRGDGMAALTDAGLRDLFADALNPRGVRAHRAWTHRVARDLLARLVADGPPGDLQSGLARPLTFAVACRVLLGDLSPREGERLNAWCDTVLVWRGRPRSEIQAALNDLHAFFLRRAPELAARAGQSVVARAARARTGDGGRLDPDGLAEFATLMLVAGYRTAASFVANALVTVVSEPGALSAVRGSAAGGPAVVEELLRHTPMSTGGVKRVATEDVRLGGLTVRAGECVLVSLEAANHDPRAYPRADRFEPGRFAADGRPRPHLGFGHGVHRCPGNALARMQLAVVVEELAALERPLRLTVPPDRLPWRADVAFRIPQAIPVTW